MCPKQSNNHLCGPSKSSQIQSYAHHFLTNSHYNKMPALKLMCLKCKANLQDTDEIHVTNCGHLYHFPCLQEWLSRENRCFQCRHENPTACRINLVLNEELAASAPSAPSAASASSAASAPSDPDVDLLAKLNSTLTKHFELQAQLRDAELNCMTLVKQYSLEQHQRKKLEQRISELANYEEEFLQLHAQYSKAEQRVKLLTQDNERLIVENEQRKEQLVLKASEISALQESLKAILMAHSNNTETQLLDFEAQSSHYEERLRLLQQENRQLALDNEYKTKELASKLGEIATLKEFRQGNVNLHNGNKSFLGMEQKLKSITAQLEKEISNSVQLSIDKIKLQSQIQRIEVQIKSNQTEFSNERDYPNGRRT
uniref:RING-type domain-containing protein n=2 Tax=Stomoxys calcitrans TaxID=35570 RepID=A0A1I8PNR3_STOCA